MGSRRRCWAVMADSIDTDAVLPVTTPPMRRPRSRGAYIDGIVESFAKSSLEGSLDGLSSPKSPQDKRRVGPGRATTDATLHDPRLQRTLEQWSRYSPVSPVIRSPVKTGPQKLLALVRFRGIQCHWKPCRPCHLGPRRPVLLRSLLSVHRRRALRATSTQASTWPTASLRRC